MLIRSVVGLGVAEVPGSLWARSRGVLTTNSSLRADAHCMSPTRLCAVHQIAGWALAKSAALSEEAHAHQHPGLV